MRLPSVRLQSSSQLCADSWLSLLIFVLRGMAAVQVVAGHLRGETFPSLRTVHAPTLYYQALAFMTGFAHQGVVVFFLISGWLVGGKILDEFGKPNAIRLYALDRVTRLWTVLVPTFLLMLAVGSVMGVIDSATVDLSASNEYSVLSFIGNMLGLQTVLVKNFAGNYALWSLASQTWYYVAFPLLLAAAVGRHSTRFFALVGLALIATLVPYDMTLYFAIWLLGAGFSRIRVECTRNQRRVLVLVIACISIYYRLTGSNDDLVPKSFVQDLVCSLPFLILLSTLHVKIDPASRPLRRLGVLARFVSNFSFTLFVIHVPAISLLRYTARHVIGRDHFAPDVAFDYAIYFGMLGIIVTTAYLIYLVFEAHTQNIRRLLRGTLMRRAQDAPIRAV
jgi:peptidoglycan/LPS O-acetylase OafA/YrhL